MLVSYFTGAFAAPVGGSYLAQSRINPEKTNKEYKWLQQKSEKLGNTFEVRWCGMQSFSGKKSTREEIINLVTELVQIEQVEWGDEEKKSFRLLND